MHEGGELIDLLAAEGSAAGDADRAHHTALSHRLPENSELALPEHLREVNQLQAETQVRLVRAEPSHSLLVGQARKRLHHLQVGPDRLRETGMQLLQEAHHVLLLDEAHLQVKLRELRLAVRPQILVPEAAGDLEVALEAGDHEELLELLR